MPPSSRWSILILGLAAACARGDAVSSGPKARIDTLPSGAVQVTSDQPTGWAKPDRGWKVTEALRITGQEGTPSELVEPGDVAVDGQGRIYLADQKPTVIKVFDSTGALVRIIGREGSGPGEFKSVFLAVRGSALAVHDPAQSRTSVFDTSGTLVKSWSSSCCYWSPISIDTAQRIYIPTTHRADGPAGRSQDRAYARYRLDGTPIDTLIVPDHPAPEKTWRFSLKGKNGKNVMEMVTSVPFMPELDQTYHPAGGFVIGWSGEYALVRTFTGRDTAMLIRRAWTPDPIPEALRRQRVDETIKQAAPMLGEEQARSVARLEDLPTLAPAFTSLHVDLAGNIWARRLVARDSGTTSYDVFAATGAWLGEVALPIRAKDFGGMAFGPGTVYATSEDEDGKPIVVKLRISR